MTTKFGWCLDGDHDNCRAYLALAVGNTILCPCHCHGRNER
jgi:hypothetical protein